MFALLLILTLQPRSQNHIYTISFNVLVPYHYYKYLILYFLDIILHYNINITKMSLYSFFLFVDFFSSFILSWWVYISQATRPPLSRSTAVSSGGGTGAAEATAAAVTIAGASLTRRRVSERCGSRHLLQSIRAQTAALRSVAAARAICTHAITIKSRVDGFVSSSMWMSLEKYSTWELLYRP